MEGGTEGRKESPVPPIPMSRVMTTSLSELKKNDLRSGN